MGKPELLELLAFHLGPLHIGATVLTTWLLMAVLAGLARFGTRRMIVEAPSRLQTALEGTVLSLQAAIESAAPSHAARLLPFVGTLWLFIGAANLVGLVPGLRSPTGDLSLTVALAGFGVQRPTTMIALFVADLATIAFQLPFSKGRRQRAGFDRFTPSRRARLPAVLVRVGHPSICHGGVVVGRQRNARPARLVVDHGRRDDPARLADPSDDLRHRLPGLPDLVDDEHAASVQELGGRKVRDERCRVRPAVAPVELDACHEDLAKIQPVPEHARRHQAATRDGQHQVVPAPDGLGEPRDERIELVPADRDRVRGRGPDRNIRDVPAHGSAASAAAAIAASPDWTTMTASLRSATYETDVAPP